MKRLPWHDTMPPKAWLAAVLKHTRISPGGCNCDIQRPDLPADFFFAVARQTTKPHPSTTALLLEELDG